MTPNPECATMDTPIVDALHTMHDGKFLHLPVVDRGNLSSIIAEGCVGVIMIFHLFMMSVDGPIQRELQSLLLMCFTSLMLL